MSETKRYDFLIIGADAAGLSAAVQIRNHAKEATIGILDKGEIISYGACGLPYTIEGIIPDFEKLIHFTPEKFAASYRAAIHTSTEAIAIAPDRHRVRVATHKGEEELEYGKLMIATGAEPVRLPLFVPSPRIFYLKNIPDGERIRRTIRETDPKSAIVVGAGYIGLEMADVLHHLGLKITVVDLAEHPVPRMDGVIGKAVLKKMEEKGIHFAGNASIRSARSDERRVVVETSAGEFSADMAIVGTGIRPSTDFLQGSGIETERGAIVVDRNGRTSHPDIFAGGDCALVYHRLLEKNVYRPLGSTANKQGRIAGMNMAGNSIQFPGIIGTQIFRFFDLALASTGLTREEAAAMGMEISVLSAVRPGKAGYYPDSGRVEAHLIVEKKSGVILGGHIIAPHHAALMVDAIGAMAQSKMRADEAAYFDAAYAPPFAPVWNALISAAGKFGHSSGD